MSETAAEEYEWVGDTANGLAHLSWCYFDYEYSVCGVDLRNPSVKKAEGRARCTICRDINDGKINGVDFI